MPINITPEFVQQLLDQIASLVAQNAVLVAQNAILGDPTFIFVGMFSTPIMS